MYDFSHLSPKVNTGIPLYSARGYGSSSRYAAVVAVYDAGTDDNKPAGSQHSDAHWIAVSREAKNNPVLALKLIKRAEPHQKAISILAASNRHLSEFTKRKMANVCPGWECLDTEDRNMEAFIYGSTHDDASGYFAGIKAANQALEKYVEPWNVEDFRSIQVR